MSKHVSCLCYVAIYLLFKYIFGSPCTCAVVEINWNVFFLRIVLNFTEACWYGSQWRYISNSMGNGLASWWRHQMEPFSALLALCAGNSPVSGEFPAQRPVTRSFDVFFDLRVNKRLSKQSWGWRFETLSRSLWRHRNVHRHQVITWTNNGSDYWRQCQPVAQAAGCATIVISRTPRNLIRNQLLTNFDAIRSHKYENPAQHRLK